MKNLNSKEKVKLNKGFDYYKQKADTYEGVLLRSGLSGEQIIPKIETIAFAIKIVTTVILPTFVPITLSIKFIVLFLYFLSINSKLL